MTLDPTAPDGQRPMTRLLLRVRRRDGSREEFYLASGLTIGPGRDNSIVLPEVEAVAPTYARVDIGDGGALLRCVGPVGSVTAAGGAVRELPLKEGVRFTIGRTEFDCVDGRRADEQALPRRHSKSMRAHVDAAREAFERAERGANSAAGRWAIRGALLLGALGLAIGGPIGLIVAIASGDWGVMWTTFVMIAVIFLLGLIFGGLVGALWGAIVGGCGPEPPASPRAIRGPLPAESWSRGEDDRSVQPSEAISGDVASGQPDDSSSPERPGSMAFRLGRIASGRSDATLFVDFSSWLGKKSATFLVWLTICVIAAVWRSSQPPQIKLDFTKPNLGLPPSKKAENATPNLQEAESHLWKSYYDRGVDRTQRGEWNLAVVDFTEAIRLNPEGSQTYSQRGGAHVKKGDYRAAIADFTEAIRLDPTYGGGYAHRGNAYMKVGEIDNAIADFSEAIRFDPTKPVNHELRGECRLKKRASSAESVGAFRLGEPAEIVQ